MYYYVYRITNIIEKKYYYGKRTSIKPPKEDLGILYFSSSKDSAFVSDQKKNPHNYIYKIVKICETNKEALNLEIKLHHRFDVGKHTSFYNKSKQTSAGFDTSGIKLSEEHRKQIGVSLKGRKLSEELKQKIKENKKPLSIETRLRMGQHRKGVVTSEETKQKISAAKLGCKRSKESCGKQADTITSRGNPNAKPINILNYYTNEYVAKDVLITEWCKNTKYLSTMLMETKKRDTTKAYCFSSRKRNTPEYNPLHYKGLYVELVHSGDLLPE